MDVKTLIKAFPDPVIIIDAVTKVQCFNAAAQDLLEKIKNGELLSHASRNTSLMKAVEEVLEKGKKTSTTFYVKRPFKRSIKAIMIPLYEDSGHNLIDVVFIHMRDISEQERLAKMRMQFIANASHELRTPLASMSGFIETLQTNARNDPQAREKFLDIMAAQARRMTRLISDLLSLSRLEMNVELPPDVKVDIIDTVSEVIDAIRPLAKNHGVKIKTRGFSVPFYVAGDKDELVQVVQNIIHNAIRYGAEGGKILIGISRGKAKKGNAPRIIISVTDYGAGIARQHLPRLTERFYRVDKIISRNRGGTGLGLAIAKHIIERHRGDLKIESNPGRGATFSVILPEAE